MLTACVLYMPTYILLASYYDSNLKLSWFKIPSEIQSHTVFAFYQKPNGCFGNLCSHHIKVTLVQRPSIILQIPLTIILMYLSLSIVFQNTFKLSNPAIPIALCTFLSVSSP